VPHFGDHNAREPDLSIDLYRPSARRTINPRRSAQRGIHTLTTTTISGGRRFLAAARGLFVPHRGRSNSQSLPWTGQARDDGDLVVSAAIRIHEICHRRG